MKLGLATFPHAMSGAWVVYRPDVGDYWTGRSDDYSKSIHAARRFSDLERRRETLYRGEKWQRAAENPARRYLDGDGFIVAGVTLALAVGVSIFLFAKPAAA